MISDLLRDQLEKRLGRISRVEEVGGGSISRALRIESESGRSFLKVQRSAPPGFFEAEAAGLSMLLAQARSLRIPRVAATGCAGDDAYILLEWLQRAPAPQHDEKLGEAVADMHHASAAGWGWPQSGFIGPLPQPNDHLPTWSEFWLLRRLEPQLRLLQHPIAAADEWRALEHLLPDLLAIAEEDGPSLLHGDLWSGNIMSTAEGPALVDPACYYGHREVDLAMAELFGGFGPGFFKSYVERWPLLPGYEARKGAYQLYYLLVHVNLFGAPYVPRTYQTLRRVLATA